MSLRILWKWVFVPWHYIDECKAGTHSCHKNAKCINTMGSYECFCHFGFHGEGRSCTDIDECRDGTHTCSKHCVNNPGSYRCSCKTGYSGNGIYCTGKLGNKLSFILRYIIDILARDDTCQEVTEDQCYFKSPMYSQRLTTNHGDMIAMLLFTIEC